MVITGKEIKTTNLSAKQQQKLQSLRAVAGSIKTNYKVDVVGSIHELRGKHADDTQYDQ